MQRNWIGKSVGAHVIFKIDGHDETFTVFTTRCDTLFGATYCVFAPEHELVDVITTPEQKEAVKAYQKECAGKSDLERTELNKEKTGVFTGAYAVNPVNGKKIPIWISDYVLATYGTGAIMAVPAHDDRDYAFAKKFGLEIIPVLEGGDIAEEAYTQDGVHINSEFLNGMGKQEAIDTMINWLSERGLGKKQVNYRLREWIFARQRYWGEPIPIVHLDDGRTVSLTEDQLPLLLPPVDDYRPGKNGASPLEKAEDWINVTVDGVHGRRETSTMPGSAGSSWYFLRYIDPHNNATFADYDLMKHWMPVDLYIGGPEHAVGHLLYSRMWTHFLYDQGLCPVSEPFQKLVHQGMILGANGIKMGKRFPKYVVDPNVVVKEYGADTMRVYEMFMGPLEASKPWSDQSLDGTRKWLERVYRLATTESMITEEAVPELNYSYNFTVKKVTNDIETLNFNTAISQMMIFVNDCYKTGKVNKEMLIGFIRMLSTFAPHIGEELNQMLTGDETVAYAAWPTYSEEALVQNKVEIVVQVNGKVRGKFEADKDADQAVIEKTAKELPNIQSFMEGKTIRKVIVIPNKIVNIVVG
jgi:leucyl-tRNA synthetase